MCHNQALVQVIARTLRQRAQEGAATTAASTQPTPDHGPAEPDKRTLLTTYRRLYVGWLNAACGLGPAPRNQDEVEEQLQVLSITLVKMGLSIPSVPPPRRHRASVLPMDTTG